MPTNSPEQTIQTSRNDTLTLDMLKPKGPITEVDQGLQVLIVNVITEPTTDINGMKNGMSTGMTGEIKTSMTHTDEMTIDMTSGVKPETHVLRVYPRWIGKDVEVCHLSLRTAFTSRTCQNLSSGSN
jgi:hypothetical protein